MHILTPILNFAIHLCDTVSSTLCVSSTSANKLCLVTTGNKFQVRLQTNSDDCTEGVKIEFLEDKIKINQCNQGEIKVAVIQ